MSDPPATPPEGPALVASVTPTASPRRTGAWLRAWLTAGVAAAVVDLAAGVSSEVPFSVGGGVLVLGLFVLTALLGAGLTRALERTAAPGGLELAARALRHALTLSLAADERAAARDACATLGMIIVAAAALTLLVAGGAYVIVGHAREPAFIALAVGAAALPTLGVALLMGLAARRALLALPRLPTPRVALVGLLTAATALGTGATLVWHETLAHLGAYALVAPAVLIGGALLLFVLMPRPLAHPLRVALVLALVASVAVVASWRLPRARSFTTRGTWSAAYLVAGLQALSDLDRDGVASFPFGADCAPLDATRSPLAREIPDNGVDENCDGQDTVVEHPTADAAASFFVPLSGEQPDLYLVTVDALRADHLGFMGYTAHPTSPDLDALVEHGVVFERAYSQDSGTAPSLWSLMVGKTPFQVELVAEGFPPNYGEGETTLAERLSAAGYTTHARLCGSLFLAPNWNLRRGFDEFEEVCHRRPRDLGPFVMDSAHALLSPAPEDAQERERERPPRFVWLHFFDPHHPYVDHEELHFGDRSIDLYDEEIRYVQTFVADALRAALDERHVRPRFVVLSADHGENFGDHGHDPHARTLYREVTHVPLVFLGTDLDARRVQAPVALGDVFPTLLNLAGIPTPPSATMSSLVPTLLGGAPDPSRPIFQENSWSRPTHHVKAMIEGRYHLIRDLTADTTELYDLIADPHERVNRADGDVAEEAAMRRELDAFISTTNIPEAYR